MTTKQEMIDLWKRFKAGEADKLDIEAVILDYADLLENTSNEEVSKLRSSFPKSNSIAAFDAIESVFMERNYPCSPLAAARAGFEAAYRILNERSTTKS